MPLGPEAEAGVGRINVFVLGSEGCHAAMESEAKSPVSAIGCLLMLAIVSIPFAVMGVILWGLFNIGWVDVSHLSRQQRVKVINVYGTGHHTDGTYQIIFTYNVDGVDYFGWAQSSITPYSRSPRIPTLCINPDQPQEYVEHNGDECGTAREARIIKAKTSAPAEES